MDIDSVYNTLDPSDRLIIERTLGKEKFLSLTEELVSICVDISKKVISFLGYLYNNYPSRRVIYLACFARKSRTRKKNIHRLLKWLRRNYKC